MLRLPVFFFIITCFFSTAISCRDANTQDANTQGTDARDALTPVGNVYEMPVPPKSEFYREARKGHVIIYKTALTPKEVLAFYKSHFKEEDATFFKKKNSDAIMVAGAYARMIEIRSKKKETIISFSKFDL